jgi:hypothetical protein
VELSLSEAYPSPDRPVESSVDRWAVAVTAGEEPSLLIDGDAVIVAMSESLEELLGLEESPVGRGLLDGVLRLLDFGPGGGELTEGEVGKVPPLLALSSARLARGLMRVRCAGGACTLDAVAAPLLDGGRVAGSLTFLSAV